MIYNESQNPLFVHFYRTSANGKACYSDTTANTVYEAVNNNIPVVGILHNYFNENSVRVYTLDEVEDALINGFETPCIIDYSFNGQDIYFLEEECANTFHLISAVCEWMFNNDSYEILLKAKMHEDYPYEYYYFEYNKGIETYDEITFLANTYTLYVRESNSTPVVTECIAKSDSDICIMPVFAVAKNYFEDNYTYYAAFQMPGATKAIQMKNDMARLAVFVDEDMNSWIENSGELPGNLA